MKIKSGIYQIRNLTNNEIYVGSAVDLRVRWNIHIHHLRNNKHHSRYLQRSYHKHGEDNFIFEILELIEDKTKLIEREQYYIDTLKPHYNICRVAGSQLGIKHSKKSIKKNIETRKKNGTFNNSRSEQANKKRSESLKNHIVTEETKKKIGIGNTGKIRTEETKKKYRETNARKGKPGTFLGKKHTEESKTKNRERQLSLPKQKCIHCNKEASPSKIARWHNDNCLHNPAINIEEEKEKRKQSKEAVARRAENIKTARSKPEVQLKYQQAIAKRPILICPHCKYKSKNKGSILRSHFDNCKKNPNFDHEAEKLKKAELSIKLKAAKERMPLITCPTCGYQNRNKGLMNRNHFSNCGIKRTYTEESKEKMKKSWVKRKKKARQ